MVRMTIEDKVYEIPQDLSLEQWANAIKFDMAEPVYWPHIIHSVTGAPVSLLKEADTEALEMAIIFIAATMNKREPVEMMNLEEMRFGEWVDLDVYSALGIDKNFKQLIDIIAPKATKASEAIWALDKYNSFKKHILSQYKELFGIFDNEELEDEEVVRQDPMQVAHSWYKVIVGLANDDLLKLDEVTEQPIRKVFNFMALKKQEALEEQERQRQQRLKYDLQRTR